MSRIEKIGNQYIDADEPVKQVVFLKTTKGLSEQVNVLTQKAGDAMRLGKHLEEWLGRWVGEIDLKAGAQDKRLVSLERRLNELQSRIYELEQKGKSQ